MLTLGSAYHKGLEVNFKQKVKTEKDLPLDVVRDAFSTEWERRLRYDDVQFIDGAKPGKVKDGGIKLVSEYHTNVAPSVQPFMVEEPFTIQAGGSELKGIIDLATSGAIIDHKTAARPWTQERADSDLQATCYLLAMHDMGVPIDSFEFHVGISEPEPDVAKLRTRRSKAEFDWYLQLLGQVTKVIQSGVFLPAMPGSYVCSERWCGYYSICKPWTR